MAIYSDPCYRAMSEPRFTLADRNRAEMLLRRDVRVEIPAVRAPVQVDPFAEIDAPLVGTLQSQGPPLFPLFSFHIFISFSQSLRCPAARGP